LDHLGTENESGEKMNPSYTGFKVAVRPGTGGDSIERALEMERVMVAVLVMKVRRNSGNW